MPCAASNRPHSDCSPEPDVSKCAMATDPQENVDVIVNDELSDEVLGGVSGGAVIGTPIAD